MGKTKQEPSVDTDLFQMPLSSLVKGEGGTKDATKRNGIKAEHLKGILQSTTEKINDAKGIMEVLPDLALARDILISSILSPKDLSKPVLSFAVDRTMLTKPVDGDILTTLEEHFKSKVKLEANLPKILAETLVDVGSWTYLMLPPSHIDELISGKESVSMEKLTELEASDDFGSVGIIAPADEASTTRLSALGIADLSDNLNGLRKFELRKSVHSNNVTSLSMEGIGGYNATAMKRVKFRGRDKRDNAAPILYKIPADAILPIHDPSDVSEHIGYFILQDKHGNAVSNVKDSDYMGTLEERLRNALADDKSEGALTIKSMGIDTTQEQNKTPEGFISEYTSMVEEELKKSLKGGIYGDFVEIEKHERLYRIMLSRKLAQEKTSIVYVPAELVSYFAFSYDSLGIGESLLEQTKLYASLRAVLMFADLMASLKNSVSRTDLSITLDEEDNDPWGTVEAVLHEFSNVENARIPIGALSPTDIISSIQKSGYKVNVDGGEKFPQTKTEISDVQRGVTKPDSELSETLKRLHYAGFGVPASLVDRTLEGDFATGIDADSVFFAKSCMVRQGDYSEMIIEFVRKYIRLHDDLYKKVVDAAGSEDAAEEYIEAMYLSLPSADTTKLSNQATAFQDYSDFIDAVMEIYIGDDLLRGLLRGDYTADVLNELRLTIGAHFKRDWLRAENILPELEALLSKEADVLVGDSIKEHYKGVFDVVGQIIVDLMRVESKTDKKIQKVEDKIDGGEEETGTGNFEDFGGKPSVPFDSSGSPFGSTAPAEPTPPTGEPEETPPEGGEELPPEGGEEKIVVEE